MTTTDIQTTTVPLNKLILWDGNVRKTGAEAGLGELAASIQAHGLIQPLTVRPASKGRFAVVAGQRRLKALQLLARAGGIDKKAPIACAEAPDGHDHAELSLAENVCRVAMHPADQFEAWAALIDRGATVPEIAARFGEKKSTVRQRLALARVSPRLFALYRKKIVTLDALMAFTVTDDHELQEGVWDGLNSWQRSDAGTIRRALTETDVATTDKRVRFVGLEAYEAAGGAVRRDLFDPEGGGFVLDAALLDTLARDRLAAIAQEVKAEGWQWVETHMEFGWEERSAFGRGSAEPVALPLEIEAEAERLEDEFDRLDREDEADTLRMQEISDHLDEIDAQRSAWPDLLKAHGGAVLYLSNDGSVETVRGLIRPEDAAALQPEAGDDSAADEVEQEPPSPSGKAPSLPATLIEDLTAQKTAALRIETARNVDVALALTVHALAGSVFYPYAAQSALKAHVTPRNLRTSIRQFSTCPAVNALSDERERIGDLLPGQQSDLWAWCLNADRDTLLDVLAVTVAHGIDAVQSRGDCSDASRLHGAALAEALKLDMGRWYRPTADGYFSRIAKAQILADLEAARVTPCAPSWAKLKKPDLADLAERETAERGWLPAPLQ